MLFISSSELCSRIKALYRKTWYLNNPFHYNIIQLEVEGSPSSLYSFCIMVSSVFSISWAKGRGYAKPGLQAEKKLTRP